MPTCTSSESLSRVWPSNESIHAGSSGFQSPTSPTSLSPISTSPDSTLLRSRFKKTSSGSTIITEPFIIQSDCRDSRCQSPVFSNDEENVESFSALAEIIGWYPVFLLRIAKAVLLATLPKTWKQLFFSLPMFWMSMWAWCFTQIINMPLVIIKTIFSVILTPTSVNPKKRTVLISGGSTIQALHLARNFYSAGARVVICDIDGLFALTRFSTAVSRYYTVPKPNSDQQQNYVRALCEIVDKEQVTYYVPVSSTTSAYFDAVAKPHLELLGCTCFCPGIKEVWALDDTLEVLKKCEKFSILTPIFHTITSREDIYHLYDTGAIRLGGYVMTTSGPSGLRERSKIVLPVQRNDLKLPNDISEQKPWVAVKDIEGDHFLTCTTIKDSQVIANVTCRIDKKNNGIVPVEKKEINQWLINFFNKLNWLRPITGHVTFRFVVPKDSTTTVVPLSSRVGISLPYICYTNVHPKLLWKTCRHFSRQNSRTSIAESTNLEDVTRLINTVIDKREALFAVWDPLPYCAYYHMLLPFRNMLGFIQKKQDSFPRPMTNPVR